MKTYPIILPSHGGEDVQAATLTEYQDGSCSIETGSTITTDHKAAAIDVIKRRWPSAYIAEAVRIEPENTPDSAPTTSWGSLLDLAIEAQASHYLDVDVSYNADRCELALEARWPRYPEDGRHNYSCHVIRCNDFTEHTQPAVIEIAKEWLDDLIKQYGNPAA